MAQGAIKKSAKPKAGNKPAQQKKGISKPQKTKAKSTADRVTKKFSSGLVAKTEALLGQRAGHLELIGQGKKARKAGAGADAAKNPKGGSRKFG